MADPEFERDPEDFEEKDFDREESELEEMQRRAVAARRLISIGIDVKQNNKGAERPTLRLDPYKKASDPVAFDRRAEFEPVFIGQHYDVGPINLEDYQLEISDLIDSTIFVNLDTHLTVPIPESYLMHRILEYVLNRSVRHYPKEMPATLVNDLIYEPEKYDQLPGIGLMAYRSAIAKTKEYCQEYGVVPMARHEYDARYRPLNNYQGHLESAAIDWDTKDPLDVSGDQVVTKVEFNWVTTRPKMKRRTSV